MARVVIIGAGHNGLVTACYLAKAGHNVTVFEKRRVVGGCCVTDETIFPGCKVSSVAYVNSMFLPQIVEDFALERRGYEVLQREPSSFTPLIQKRKHFSRYAYLMLGHSRHKNEMQITKFSSRDANRYRQYEKMLDKAAGVMGGLLTENPPNFPPYRLNDFSKFGRLAWELMKLGPIGNWQFARLMLGDAVKLLNRWFESDILKTTLLMDSTIGALDFRGYLLLHHVMGEAGGARGVWGYMRGGVGAISNALTDVARELGVKIYLNQPVDEIVCWGDEAYGVRVGRELIEADLIVSNLDPYRTFTHLSAKNLMPNVRKYRRKIYRLNFNSATMKVNLKLSGLPSFRCLPNLSTKVEPQHKGTIHLAGGVDYITEAAKQAREGKLSENPVLEITIPTAIDNTLAPSGTHLMNIFVQYAPRCLTDGLWEDPATKVDYFANNILPVMKRYIRNVPGIIEGIHIYSPLDLEREFGLTGGNILHGAMTLGQLFCFRPLRGWAEYKTPIKGLYLCGAGTHPGGGISGINGYNSAREILRDLIYRY